MYLRRIEQMVDPISISNPITKMVQPAPSERASLILPRASRMSRVSRTRAAKTRAMMQVGFLLHSHRQVQWYSKPTFSWQRVQMRSSLSKTCGENSRRKHCSWQNRQHRQSEMQSSFSSLWLQEVHNSPMPCCHCSGTNSTSVLLIKQFLMRSIINNCSCNHRHIMGGMAPFPAKYLANTQKNENKERDCKKSFFQCFLNSAELESEIGVTLPQYLEFPLHLLPGLAQGPRNHLQVRPIVIQQLLELPHLGLGPSGNLFPGVGLGGQALKFELLDEVSEGSRLRLIKTQ